MAPPTRVRYAALAPLKIVLAASGSRGDVQPITLLAEALNGRGHEVTFYAPKSVPVALSPGITVVAEGMDAQALMTMHRKDIQSHLGFLRVVTRVVDEEVERQFRHLVPLVKGADVFVSGGVVLAGASVSEATGVPFVPVAYIATIIESPGHAPLLLPLETHSRAVNRVLWAISNAFLALFVGRPLNRQRALLGLPPARRLMTHFKGRHRGLLAADPELSPLPADLESFVHVTGAWTRDEPAPLPAQVERFLEAGPAPVYVGFGSMSDPRPDETTRMVVEIAERLGARVLLSRGWAGLGGGSLPASVLAVGEVSHSALFPRVSAIVHHGGAGTTAAALRAGKPQGIVAHIADQFSTGRQLVALGVAPPLVARKRLDRARLEAVFAAATGDERMARRAAELGETLRGRRGLDEAVAWLERRGFDRTER